MDQVAVLLFTLHHRSSVVVGRLRRSSLSPKTLQNQLCNYYRWSLKALYRLDEFFHLDSEVILFIIYSYSATESFIVVTLTTKLDRI